MVKLVELIKEHKFALILAVFVSIIVVLPQIYFRIEHRDDGVYQGIELLPDSPWSARVREIQDGHSLGSIYYKDGKDNPYLFQPLGSMVVGYMGKLFSLGINNTILLSRIVLPFLTVVLMYAFVYLFSRSKDVALSATSIILLVDGLLSPFGISQVVSGVSPSSFLEIARPVNSAMIFIPLFAFLCAFWRFYQTKNWKYGFLSSFFLGLNFYNYFYSWTYLYAFGSLLGLIFLIQKKWKEVGVITMVYAGALIFFVPYAINLWKATKFPSYEEVSLRFGVVFTYAPIFIGFVALVSIIVFLLFFKREDKEKYFFGLAIMLAPLITMNQQLLTGKVIQAGHYHWYFHKPMAIVFLLIIVFELLSRFSLNSCRKWFAAMTVLISMATGSFVQAWSFYVDYPSRDGGERAITRQKYGPVMKWLNANAAKESVVFANDEASHITVIYTPLNVFYHRAAIYQLEATTKRLIEVLFSLYRLRGVDALQAEKVFMAERGYISSNIYGMHYKEVLGSYEAIPDGKIEEIIELYKESLSVSTDEWFKNILDKYKVEYLIWDYAIDPMWKLDRFTYLEKAAEFGHISIYRLKA